MLLHHPRFPPGPIEAPSAPTTAPEPGTKRDSPRCHRGRWWTIKADQYIRHGWEGQQDKKGVVQWLRPTSCIPDPIHQPIAYAASPSPHATDPLFPSPGPLSDYSSRLSRSGIPYYSKA